MMLKCANGRWEQLSAARRAAGAVKKWTAEVPAALWGGEAAPILGPCVWYPGTAASQHSSLTLQQSRHALKWQFFPKCSSAFYVCPLKQKKTPCIKNHSRFFFQKYRFGLRLPIHPQRPQLMMRGTRPPLPVPLCMYPHHPGNQTAPHLPSGCQNPPLCPTLALFPFSALFWVCILL